MTSCYERANDPPVVHDMNFDRLRPDQEEYLKEVWLRWCLRKHKGFWYALGYAARQSAKTTGSYWQRGFQLVESGPV